MSEAIQNISYDGWEIRERLGSGSYSSVYRIEREIFGKTEQAALKVISIPKSAAEVKELQMNGYDSKSITEYYNSCLENIVHEYMYMADLKGSANIVYCDDIRYVQKKSGVGWDILIRMELLEPFSDIEAAAFSEADTIRLGMDICRALEACEKKNIVHRDIKPQNIFVSKSGDYKLGDFGVAKTMEKTSGGTIIGTINFMAPEVFNNQPYGKTADIYSLGMVLYWLANERRFPFLPLPPEVIRFQDIEDATSKRMHGYDLPAPVNGSNELKKVILKACAYDPQKRYADAEEMRKALQALTLPKNAATEKKAKRKPAEKPKPDILPKYGDTVLLNSTLDQPVRKEQPSLKTPKMPDSNGSSGKMKRFVLPAIIVCAALLVVLIFLPKGSSAKAPVKEPDSVIPDEDIAVDITDEDTLNVGIVMDTSGSMLFPEILVPYANTDTRPVILEQESLNQILNPNDTYFVVGEKADYETVYRIRYDGAWKYSNASFWLGDKIPEEKEFKTGSPTRFGVDPAEYTIYKTYDDYFETMETDPYCIEAGMGNRLCALKTAVINAGMMLEESDRPVNLAWNAFAANVETSYGFEEFNGNDEASITFYDRVYSLLTYPGTDISSGLKDAYDNFGWEDVSGKKRLILITDAPSFSWDSVSTEVMRFREAGIPITVILLNMYENANAEKMYTTMFTANNFGDQVLQATESFEMVDLVAETIDSWLNEDY